MARPYFNFGIAQIEQLVKASETNRELLDSVRNELKFRETNRARALKNRVEKLLAQLEPNENPARPNEYDDLDDLDDLLNGLDDLDEEIPEDTFHIISCKCGRQLRFDICAAPLTIRCPMCKFRFAVKIENSVLLIESLGILQEFNPYLILGVEGIATIEEVKKAYRVKVQEYHPDKVAQLGAKLREIAEEEMKRINEAYSVLKEELGFK